MKIYYFLSLLLIFSIGVYSNENEKEYPDHIDILIPQKYYYETENWDNFTFSMLSIPFYAASLYLELSDNDATESEITKLFYTGFALFNIHSLFDLKIEQMIGLNEINATDAYIIHDEDPFNLFTIPFRSENILSPEVLGLSSLILYLSIDSFETSYIDNYFDKTSIKRYGHNLSPEGAFAVDITENLLMSYASSIGEEIIFRNLLYQKFGGDLKAVYLTSVLFGATHIFNHISKDGIDWVPMFRQFGYTTALGLVMGYLTHINDGDISKAITIHFVNNLIALTLNKFIDESSASEENEKTSSSIIIPSGIMFPLFSICI